MSAVITRGLNASVSSINDIQSNTARNLVASLAPSVQGQDGRGRLWHASKALQENGIDAEEALDLLSEHFNQRCVPPWSYEELASTVRRAFHQDGLKPSRLRFPSLDAELRDQVIESSCCTLEKLSKVHPPVAGGPCPGFYLDRLFSDGDPLLCVGDKINHFATKPKSTWMGGLAGMQYMVPNAMSSPYGRPQGLDYASPRCLENTGPRCYLVVEFDLAELDKRGCETIHAPFIRKMVAQGMSVADINASLIAHLATKAPLVMAVDSGGKSLHGWFQAKNVPEAVLTEFFAYACRLGADRSLWTRCQAVRVPDGTRDNGRVQEVKFFNPEVIK